MAIKTFDQIAKFGKKQVREVKVPSWGDSVFLREMDAEGMHEFLNSERDDAGGFTVKACCDAIVLHLCDAEGNLMVKPDKRAEASKQLASQSYAVVNLLFAECMKVSGLATEEIANAAKK